MKSLLPGQAAIVRLQGRVCVVICDHRENLSLGDGAFDLFAELDQMTIQGVTVAALRFVFVLTTAGQVQQRYVGWINELEEHVVEDLGTQAELTVILADAEGKHFGESTVENTLKRIADYSLGSFAEHAAKTPWTPAHFAEATAFIEAGRPRD